MKDRITGKSIPVNKKLSSMDVQVLNQMYPCCGKSSLVCERKVEGIGQKYVYLARIISFNVAFELKYRIMFIQKNWNLNKKAILQ